MARTDDPYSRVYWRIVDDDRFAEVYGNDRNLAAWLRLLLIADQAWPASAQVPATVRRQSVDMLVAAGLVELRPGGIYRVHGLDAERQRRSSVGDAGASARWSERNANAMRTHTDRNTIPMLEKTSQEKTSQAKKGEGLPVPETDDLWALYGALTRAVARKPAVLDWLERIENAYGITEAARVLRDEHAKDGNPGTLLGRVNARLEHEAKKAEVESKGEKRGKRIESQVMARRLEEFRFTGIWREEWGEQRA